MASGEDGEATVATGTALKEEGEKDAGVARLPKRVDAREDDTDAVSAEDDEDAKADEEMRASGAVLSYFVTRNAHLKILLHCAKHPWADVNGALIGRRSESGKLKVTDAIPFFHTVTMVPMLEVGMMLVEEFCKSDQTPEGTEVVGWYHSSARMNADLNSTPATRIANGIHKNGKPDACLIMIRSSSLADEMNSELEIMTKSGSSWSIKGVKSETELKNTKDFTILLKMEKQNIISDMDDWLMDTKRDWRNQGLV